MENLFKIIGVLHIIFATLISFYGFIFKKSWFDYVFIFYNIIIVLSWTFYNGECLITYYIKKYYDNNYISGKDPTDLKDMYLLFGNKYYTFLIVSSTILINVLSEYIVLKRNGYSSFEYIGIPLSHLMYTIALRTFKKLYENNLFLYIQNFFKLLFTIFLLLSIHKLLYVYNVKI